jgi:hypothetical protein
VKKTRQNKKPGLRQLDAQDGMPPLPAVELALWHREPGASPAADHLAAYIANDVGSDAAHPATMSSP